MPAKGGGRIAAAAAQSLWALGNARIPLFVIKDSLPVAIAHPIEFRTHGATKHR
jgi:hypothetical protein